MLGFHFSTISLMGHQIFLNNKLSQQTGYTETSYVMMLNESSRMPIGSNRPWSARDSPGFVDIVPCPDAPADCPGC